MSDVYIVLITFVVALVLGVVLGMLVNKAKVQAAELAEYKSGEQAAALEEKILENQRVMESQCKDINCLRRENTRLKSKLGKINKEEKE